MLFFPKILTSTMIISLPFPLRYHRDILSLFRFFCFSYQIFSFYFWKTCQSYFESVFTLLGFSFSIMFSLCQSYFFFLLEMFWIWFFNKLFRSTLLFFLHQYDFFCFFSFFHHYEFSNKLIPMISSISCMIGFLYYRLNQWFRLFSFSFVRIWIFFGYLSYYLLKNVFFKFRSIE